ncbi:hypothetical protein Goklo_025245 [Gossypium klotzschianum]|uniref:DUF4283 domain-containing protein n=1 Tax=Gossypium klotzschianum TaxID=34286 RepID=A0A7J8WC50_9ROSI|nr:hypothetical protein [Gossypium klotzschianum]
MLVGQSSKETLIDLEGKADLDILEGDIQKTFVDGVPSISFSDRIHKILIQGMENTVILKLLGRNIGFSVLQNKLFNLWRPSAPLHMMDIENGYFLVKFQNKLDCERALPEGPWIIFSQYLTVQPWSLAFDPTQAYPRVVMAWIRFPGLPGYLYNHKIITEIGEMVGKVVKLDMNTDSRTRGRLTRLAVYVDLEKPLVSHILINGRKQNVEYESLSTICFHCGRYGHVENSYPFKNSKTPSERENSPSKMASEFQNTTKDDAEKEHGNFGPWMIVEKKSRWKIRDNAQNPLNDQQIGKEGSRFRALNNKDMYKEDFEGFLPDNRRHKGKEILHGNSMEKISAIPNNGRIVGERSSNNKDNLKEVNQMGNCGPISKKNDGINAKPSKPSTSLKGNLHNTKKPDSSLGIETIPVGQARGVLELSGPDLVVHHPSVAAGKKSRTFFSDESQMILGEDVGLEFEGEGSKNQPVLEESRRTEVSLDVGNLDFGRHSAVVFHENTKTKEKNIAHPSNNYAPSLVFPSGSSKAFKNRGRGFAKKQTKILHGSNVRFKTSGVQRIPLKESMEFLAESISTFAKSNIEVESSIEIGGQKEGINVPRQ